MKKQILLAAMLASTAMAHASSWVDDWLAQSTTTSPGHFEGQKRDYFTGGGLQARWRMTNDNPVSITLPRVRAGCGGIDLSMGGISYLDPEYLVQKLQHIVQAAPALAFDMAMKEMSKEAAESMTKLEAATNWMNNLQLNDCAISKRVVASVKNDDPDIMGSVWNEISGSQSMSQAMDKSWADYQKNTQANKGIPTTDMRNAIASCPADFLALFTGGSVIDNATTRLGLGNYADIMRAYMGDVEVAWDATNLVYTANHIDPCRENNTTDIVDFVYGAPRSRHNVAAGGDCYQDSTTNMNDYVYNMLNDIGTAIANNTQLTQPQITFITTAPLPVMQIMKTAVLSGGSNQQEVASGLAEPLAYVFAYRMMDDLYTNVEYVIRKANSAANPVGVGSAAGDAAYCKPAALKNITTGLEDWGHKVGSERNAIRDAYQIKVKEVTANLEYAQREQAHRDEVYKGVTQAVMHGR